MNDNNHTQPGRIPPAAPQPGGGDRRRRRRMLWPSALAAGGVLAIAVAAPALAMASPAPAQAAAAVRPAFPEVETSTYQGHATQSVLVPAGANAASVEVIGARGGWTEGTCCPVIVTHGGPGAVVSGVIRVSPGQTLNLKIGQYRGNGVGNKTPGQGGWGPTGNGGRGGSGANRDGGGGGGSTQLMIGSSTVAVAGGGGGAGGFGFIYPADSGGTGGSGDRSPGGGVSGSGPGAGKGGAGGGNTQGVGGAVGGNGSNVGGGGGGGGDGRPGGSGGAGGGFGAGGGGGGGAGNSYFTSLLQSGTIGRAGDDADGKIIIRWQGTPQRPVCSDQTISVAYNSPGVPIRLRCTELSRPEYFQLVSLPDHGFLDNRNLQAGTMTYVPHAGYTGTDSLIFVAVSGGVFSAPGTVTFHVGQ
jgi:hypothetical protein